MCLTILWITAVTRKQGAGWPLPLPWTIRSSAQTTQISQTKTGLQGITSKSRFLFYKLFNRDGILGHRLVLPSVCPDYGLDPYFCTYCFILLWCFELWNFWLGLTLIFGHVKVRFPVKFKSLFLIQLLNSIISVFFLPNTKIGSVSYNFDLRFLSS